MELSGWILSIAGICLLSVVVDLILPDGSMNSHIKKVFSYFVVIAVLLPLVNFFKGGVNLEDVFSEVEIAVQDDFIYNVNQAKIDSLTEEVGSKLQKKGLYGVSVSISADIFDVNMQIEAVYVDLYNAVINGNDKNINIKTEVKCVIIDTLNIKEEKIVFYEWKKVALG